MSDSNTRHYRKANPDAYPTPIRPDQDGLPFAQDGADAAMAPDVQADVDAASNGRTTRLPWPGAGDAKPEADVWDLDRLRLSQDFATAAGVKRLIKTIPVRKPANHWFVRTHPDPAYRLSTAVLELKEDRETYLAAPALWPELASEPTFHPALLVTSISRQGVLFLWQVRLPGADGRIDGWSRSAMDAADEAKTRWVRVTSNMALGAYEVAVASGQVAEPAWPDITFQEIIRVAFRDRMIESWDHPVLQRLRGEV
jgi:hypothetical protein